jgi:hypothetical protein
MSAWIATFGGVVVFVARTASGARTGSLGPTASALVRVSRAGRVFRRRWASIANETRRDPRSRSNAPRRRTARICSVRVMVVEAFPSLCWIGAQGRGQEPPRDWPDWDPSTGPVGSRAREAWRQPRSKTDNPCLSPRGADSAVGGIRAWARNPGRRASSCSTLLLARAFMCPRPQTSSSAASPTAADAAQSQTADMSLCIGLTRRAAPSRGCGPLSA